MSNEVAVKSTNAVATTEMLNEWGAPTTSAQDVIIPKLLPMQGMSDLVTSRKAMIGEFRDSLSGALLGNIDDGVEVIPFYLQKAWDIMAQQPDGQYKWQKSFPVVENPADPAYNDNWPWETEQDGVKIRNVRRFNYFVLLPNEVAAGGAIPYMLSFKSKSAMEGKKLFTQMYIRNIRANLPPAAFHVKISGKMETNDKGTFVAIKYSPLGRSTDAELAECLNWIKMIRGGQAKVDMSEETDLQHEAVAADGAGEF